MLDRSVRRALIVVSASALSVAAVSSAHATDPTAKWCQGVKIAAFPGGPQGGVFANNVFNGGANLSASGVFGADPDGSVVRQLIVEAGAVVGTGRGFVAPP